MQLYLNEIIATRTVLDTLAETGARWAMSLPECSGYAFCFDNVAEPLDTLNDEKMEWVSFPLAYPDPVTQA